MCLVFAIRHIRTGLCMPNLGKGYSYWEPLLDNHKSLYPRILFTRKSAQNVISAWAQGLWKRNTDISVDWEGVAEGYDNIYVDNPKLIRCKTDLEIVSLTLFEIPGSTHANK